MSDLSFAQRLPSVTTSDEDSSATTQRQPLVLYEAMVSAIAQCARIDEIKDVRDKAAALEMYHRQAGNFDAEREAANVRLRAERRAGELLKELARAEVGAVRNPTGRAGKEPMSRVATLVSPPSPYAEALETHGITRQKAHRYQALANVPEKIFEEALSGPEKPTAVRVAARAKVRQAADPIPEMSTEGLWLWGRLRDFENKGYLTTAWDRLLSGMTDGMREDVRRLAPLVSIFLTSLETSNVHA